MPEESTTPDLLEQTRRRVETAKRRDFDAAAATFARDAVFDMSAVGLGLVEGREAIRCFFEDWQRSYAEFDMQVEDFRHVGNGVTLIVFLLRGRPTGTNRFVELRYAAVEVWTGGLVERATNYTDLDEARAAAERLAAERA